MKRIPCCCRIVCRKPVLHACIAVKHLGTTKAMFSLLFLNSNFLLKFDFDTHSLESLIAPMPSDVFITNEVNKQQMQRISKKIVAESASRVHTRLLMRTI